jgi:phosphate transport system substrate-binding protein
MLKFFDWCFRNGAETAKKLDYVPIPDKVYALVEAMWKEKVRANGKPVWQ